MTSRKSGIPGLTPGRPSTGIPTPSRSRSSSVAGQYAPVPGRGEEMEMSRAFADAIKANDPGRYNGRPSSVASNHNDIHPRTKTPTAGRPASRHSDVFAPRSSSRTGHNKSFEVGDTVRIESLGYEGTLRFIGEIDGKQGFWAGVELAGGFAGKGKNDGSVAGKRYFICPPNCGVFVATTKLSVPPLRPSSVASSRSGRMTPSMLSSRATPSASTSSMASNGRRTPSLASSRAAATPAAKARPSNTFSKSTTTTPTPFTTGSRASKYSSMTAKQLQTRDSPVFNARPTDPGSPVRMNAASPSRGSATSPTRPPGSPFATPKPGLSGRGTTSGPGTTPSKIRSSTSTPRARIPSAIAMPPPPSPMAMGASSRAVSASEARFTKISQPGSPAIGEDLTVTDLQLSGKLLQDKIAHLMSSSSAPSSSEQPLSASRSLDSGLVSSLNDSKDQSELQSRVDTLEHENAQLQSNALVQTEEIRQQRDQATTRVSELSEELRVLTDLSAQQQLRVSTLEDACAKANDDLSSYQTDSDLRFAELQTQLNSTLVSQKSLEEAIAAKEAVAQEYSATLNTKETDISRLEASLRDVQQASEVESKELKELIDELRQAGQETIALYEERLSTTESQRYELETRLSAVESRRLSASSPSNTTTPNSALQIDNETLHLQISHLTKKITSLEESLEDSQLAAEREDAAMRERMKRLKEKEDGIKKEAAEARAEAERMGKREEEARGRVGEIEEALRESTLALEEARAEVEGLRNEIDNLDGLLASSTSNDASSRVAEAAQRASADRAQLSDRIAELQRLLDESEARGDLAMEELVTSRESIADREDLEVQNQLTVKTLEAQLAEERHETERLRQALGTLSTELDTTRNKMNREPAQSPSSSPSKETKHEQAAAREEIAGLKHIVQDLQQSNLAEGQKNKMLESENQLLLSEAEQLRQEVKILEENMDNSLTVENANDLDPGEAAGGGVESLQRMMKEQKTKFEAEIEQLRKRMTDTEMKAARTTHDLNKEISELEALVESKIYREDELEQELERVKEKLARAQRKSSKHSIEPMPDSQSWRSSIASSASVASTGSVTSDGGEECEICGKTGHDIFNCDLLKEDGSSIKSSSSTHSDQQQDTEPYCSDCLSHGHLASECPHSLDVF